MAAAMAAVVVVVAVDSMSIVREAMKASEYMTHGRDPLQQHIEIVLASAPAFTGQPWLGSDPAFPVSGSSLRHVLSVGDAAEDEEEAARAVHRLHLDDRVLLSLAFRAAYDTGVPFMSSPCITAAVSVAMSSSGCSLSGGCSRKSSSRYGRPTNGWLWALGLTPAAMRHAWERIDSGGAVLKRAVTARGVTVSLGLDSEYTVQHFKRRAFGPATTWTIGEGSPSAVPYEVGSASSVWTPFPTMVSLDMHVAVTGVAVRPVGGAINVTVTNIHEAHDNAWSEENSAGRPLHVPHPAYSEPVDLRPIGLLHPSPGGGDPVVGRIYLHVYADSFNCPKPYRAGGVVFI